MEHGLSCSAACVIFPDQGLNPCPLHWQADSQPLRHQGSPHLWFISEIQKVQGHTDSQPWKQQAEPWRGIAGPFACCFSAEWYTGWRLLENPFLAPYGLRQISREKDHFVPLFHLDLQVSRFLS